MCERIDNYLVFSLVYSNRKLAYNKHCAIKLYGIYGNFKITNFHDYERGITGIFKRINKPEKALRPKALANLCRFTGNTVFSVNSLSLLCQSLFGLF